MNTKFRRPSAAAPNRSDWTAMRLRSRLVTWTMTSMPRSCSSLPTARGSMAMRARGDSVTLMRVDRTAQQLGGGEQLREVGALGRSEFAGDDELLGGEFRREARIHGAQY